MGDQGIRVLIVDDNDAVRDVLARALRRVPGLEVAGVAESGEQACEATQSLKPDVVVMDIRMQGIGGIEAARRIATTSPDTCIIGVSASDGGPDVEAMRIAGVVDFVPKSSCVDRLVRSIQGAVAVAAFSRLQPAEAAVDRMNSSRGAP